MSYSFIKPALKPVFSLFSKIWISAIIFIIVFFGIINIFVKFYTYSLDKHSVQNQAKYDAIYLKINSIKEEIEVATKQRDAALDIYSSNNILKKSMNNLFDLVPDSVTLNNVFLDRNLLIIKGTTPTKETYKLLMEAPLKSIFNSSNTTFYQLKNGWFNFVSINKIDTSEGFNE